MSTQLLQIPLRDANICHQPIAMSVGECADHHRRSPRSGFLSNESYSNTGKFIRTVQDQLALSSSLIYTTPHDGCLHGSEDDTTYSFTSDSSHHSLIIEDTSASSPVKTSLPALVVVTNAVCTSPEKQAERDLETSPAHSSHSSDGTATGCESTQNHPTEVPTRPTLLALQNSLGIAIPSRFAGTPTSSSLQLANQDSLEESHTPVPDHTHLLTRDDSDATQVGGDPALIRDDESLDGNDSACSSLSVEGIEIQVQSTEQDTRDRLFDHALKVHKDVSTTGHRHRHTHFDLKPVRRTSLQLPNAPFEPRKTSDPSVRLRRESVHSFRSLRKQRCLSDSEAPNFSVEEDEFRSEEGGSSALGYDSGFNDERSSKFQESIAGTWTHNSPAVSDNDSHDFTLMHKTRKVTPLPFRDTEHILEEQHPRISIGTASQRKRQSSKYSASSLGGTSSLVSSSESVISSLWECQSPVTATSILSSLGFDDYSAPQLIPDRFIPRDMEHIKPSMMRANTISQQPPPSPDSVTFANSLPASVRAKAIDLPLGATAETFLHRSASPPLAGFEAATKDDTELDCAAIYTNPTISQFTPGRGRLETVPEETASDLSPSPRWLSPRVSIDHSVIDVADGKLGASLIIQKPRKRSLPQREGYKVSIGSQVESETGDSIYFSVTSYDDELAAEREKEREELGSGLSLPEDAGIHRRRRRGVYVPPAGLLTWINTQQNTISEEDIATQDPDELPWPFNEEAHLRKSLTEMQLAQEGLLEIQRAQESSSNDQTSGGDFLDESEDDLTREMSRSPSPARYSLCDLEDEDNLSALGSLDNLGEDNLHESVQPDADSSLVMSHDFSEHDAHRKPQFGPVSPHHSPAMGVRRTRPANIHDPSLSHPLQPSGRKIGNVWGCQEIAAVQRNETPVMGLRRPRTPVHIMGQRHGRLNRSFSRDKDRSLNDTLDLFDSIAEDDSQEETVCGKLGDVPNAL